MKGELRSIPIELIKRCRYQPREDIDPTKLSELAASIRIQGVIQPIVVRPVNSGYELIAGERRWRAAQLVGLAEIPAVVRDIPDGKVAAIALIENIQREALNPIEEAMGFSRLRTEFGLTQQEVADETGKPRSVIANAERLLQLHRDVIEMVRRKEIKAGHGKVLGALDLSEQKDVAEECVRKRWSVRALEAHIENLRQRKTRSDGCVKRDPNIERLEERLESYFGNPITLTPEPGGKWRFSLKAHDLAHLDGVLEKVSEPFRAEIAKTGKRWRLSIGTDSLEEMERMIAAMGYDFGHEV